MKLYAPAGCASVSFDGQTYDVLKDGSFEIPAKDFTHLAAHGFTLEPAVLEEKQDQADPKPVKAKKTIKSSSKKVLDAPTGDLSDGNEKAE